MTKYVALLRGIGPTNPSMKSENLRAVLDDLGFHNVQTLITSGNVLFESQSGDQAAMEAKIEAAWPRQLGFQSTTIIRSQAQLLALVEQDPYPGASHGRESYLLVTFFQQPPQESPKENYYDTLAVHALCSTINTTTAKTPDFMAKLERQFGKKITSRTWNTIQRILAKMAD